MDFGKEWKDLKKFEKLPSELRKIVFYSENEFDIVLWIADTTHIHFEEVYEIFESLKILSDSLNSFFANGLKDDTLAKTSIDNAENIQTKEILQPDE